MNLYTKAVVVPALVGTAPTRITSASVILTQFQVPHLIQSEDQFFVSLIIKS